MKLKVALPRVAKKTALRAYTLIEVIVVIVVISVLAGIVTFSVNSWRDRAANTEVTSDILNVASAMKNARTWNNGYPVYPDDTVFDGTGDAGKLYKQSANVLLSYYHGDAGSYCIEARSTVRPNVYYFIDASTVSTVPKKGTCVMGEGGVPVPTDASQTLFVFDTRLSGCNGTV